MQSEVSDCWKRIEQTDYDVNRIESSVEKVKEDVQALHDLIRRHDVIFLLTDSRESRWLPTVIAAAEQKVNLSSS